MTPKAATIVQDFKQLSRQDQVEVMRELGQFMQGRGMVKQGGYRSDSEAITLGPQGGGCPLCGRG